jgi:hypothetical protein
MTWRYFAVDRLEKRIAVLLADDGTPYDMPVGGLPVKRLREGDVLKVEMSEDGSPDWTSATRDSEEKKRRGAEAEKILNELKKRDPGGDIVL